MALNQEKKICLIQFSWIYGFFFLFQKNIVKGSQMQVASCLWEMKSDFINIWIGKPRRLFNSTSRNIFWLALPVGEFNVQHKLLSLSFSLFLSRGFFFRKVNLQEKVQLSSDVIEAF